MGSAPPEGKIRDQWRDHSTDSLERYMMSLRDACGFVIRKRSAGAGYSAYVGCEGRQQWAEQLFGNFQDAQTWCEGALVMRTNNEAKQ
jgi:hypothetical protein